MHARTIKIVSATTLVLLAIIGGPFTARAHTSGSFWEVPAGDYFADVGYDPAIFVEGRYTRFDFGLFKDRADTGSIPFAEVWVRIKKEKNTLLATGIRTQPIGPTTLLYTFQNAGNYSLETSFRDKEGVEIAAASFPITVIAEEGVDTAQLMYSMLLLISGAITGAISMFYLKKYLLQSRV